jgi:uncharacterized damage-inducible protein DinB
MKGIALAVLLACTLYAGAQQKQPSTLRSILLTALKNSHDKSDSFVCGNIALANLTPQQANWTDGKGNHSVGQLAYHMVFWDKYSVAKLRHETPEKFSGNNDDTFTNFDPKQWSNVVHQFDDAMTRLERMVESATDEQLAEWAPELTLVANHNAYHIGEIVMVRKEQGVWDASKGVK